MHPRSTECTYSPEVNLSKVFTQCFSAKEFNQYSLSQRNTQHSVSYNSKEKELSVPHGERDQYLKNSTAGLTACLFPTMSNAAVRKIKTSAAGTPGTCQLDSRLCHIKNFDKWHIFFVVTFLQIFFSSSL